VGRSRVRPFSTTYTQNSAGEEKAGRKEGKTDEKRETKKKTENI